MDVPRKSLTPDMLARLRSGADTPSRIAKRIEVWTDLGYDLSPITGEALPPIPVRHSELTEPEAFAKFPCLYREETAELHTCKPCRGSRVHTLCQCHLLNRPCTVLASDAKGPDKKPVETCLTCEQRKPPECPHLSKGCCGLAAVAAGAPVNFCQVMPDQCSRCLREKPEPDVENLTETVKDVALKAVHQWQPQRAKAVGKEMGIDRRPWTPSTVHYLRNRAGKPVEIGGLYVEATVFLVCGGPSINRQDLSGLRSRGVLVAAVNQVAATHVRPDLWFSVDDPSKFHESIWKDPGILCFTKRKYLRHAVWETKDSARSSGRKAHDCPGVLGFEHRDEWPCDFLAGPPTWGKPGTFKSVFVVALRILADLGVSRICLLGADFHMDPQKPYAFDQDKGPAGIASNNGYYSRMNRDLPAVWKQLLSIGCEIVNCTPGSHLTAFPTSTLADELARVKITPPASVAGLY